MTSLQHPSLGLLQDDRNHACPEVGNSSKLSFKNHQYVFVSSSMQKIRRGPLGLRACRSSTLNPLPSSSPSKPREGDPSLPSPGPRLGHLFPNWKGASSRNELFGSLWGALGAAWGGSALFFQSPFPFRLLIFEKKHALLPSEAIFLPMFIKKQVPGT